MARALAEGQCGMSRVHHPSGGPDRRRPLTIVLVLTCGYLIAEVIAGWLTHSLALLADAGHMLTDVAGLGLALTAMTFAVKPATPDRTYGYYRPGVGRQRRSPAVDLVLHPV